MKEQERQTIEKGSRQSRFSLPSMLLYFWAFLTAALAGYSAMLYQENREIQTVPVFIYAGPNAPQDIVAKINQSMDNFDEKNVEEWYKDRGYDKDFQMAMFYSYLSNALAEKEIVTKDTFRDGARRDAAFKKSLQLWSSVVKKDEELVVFRNYFVNRYRNTLKNN